MHMQTQLRAPKLHQGSCYLQVPISVRPAQPRCVKARVLFASKQKDAGIDMSRFEGWDPRCGEDEPCAALSISEDTSNLSSRDEATLLARSTMRRQAFQDYLGELARPEAAISPLVAAVHVARATKFPELQLSEVEAQLAPLVHRVQHALRETDRKPATMLDAVLDVVYREKEFCGNEENKCAETNSYINTVLNTRTGSPIALAIVVREVAARVGLKLSGLSLPGAFLLQPDVPGMEQVLVDAFSGDKVTVAEAEKRVSDLMGAKVKIDPAKLKARKGAEARVWMQRLLNNLKQVYLNCPAEAEHALHVVRLMRATQPSSLPDMRDEGLCLYNLNRHDEAALCLEAYLKAAPNADDADMIRTMVKACRGAK